MRIIKTPIFLWLNHIVGGNILLTIGAIAGGSDTYLGKGKAGTLDAKLSRLTKWVAAVFVLLTLFVALLGSL